MNIKREREYIDMRKAQGCYGGERVGILKQGLSGMVPFRTGEAVLFRPDYDIEAMERGFSHVPGPNTTMTIEKLLSEKEIEENERRGSGIRTWGTTINVPFRYIDPVVL